MPELDKEELGVRQPLAQQCDESIAGVPIKKRRFIFSRPSFLPSESLTLPPNDFPHGGALSALGANIGGECSLNHPKYKNSIRTTSVEFDITNVIPRCEETDLQHLNMFGTSTFPADVGKEQLQPLLKRPSDTYSGEGRDEIRSDSSDNSAFPDSSAITQQVPSTNGGNNKAIFVKQEKMDQCLMMPAAEGQTTFVPKSSDTDRKVDSCLNSVNRSNWDLNVPMDTWDTSDDFPMEHDGGSKLNHTVIQKQKVEACSQQAYATQYRGIHNVSLSKTATASGKNNAGEVALDLQLKPPTRPELRIKWGAMNPPDLSLSLTGKLTSKAVKVEPSDMKCQKSKEEVIVGSQKVPDLKNVKSEPCDGAFQGKAAKETGFGDQDLASNGMVKIEPLDEPSRGCLRKTLGEPSLSDAGNCRTSTYHSAELQKTTDHLEMREVASATKDSVSRSGTISDEHRLQDGREISNNFKMASTGNAARAFVLGSQSITSDCNKSHKGEETISGTFKPEGSEGAVSNISHLFSKSSYLEGKVLNTANGGCEVVRRPSNSILESVVSYQRPDASYGMSQGSAEMDFSDDDNSSQVATIDKLHIYPYGNCQTGENDDGRILCPDNQENDNQRESCSSSVTGARVKIPKQEFGDGEHGEVAHDVTQSAVVGLKDGEERPSDRDVSGNFCSVSTPAPVALDVNSNDKQVSMPHETKASHKTEHFNVNLCEYKNDTGFSSTDLGPSSVSGASNDTSLNMKVIKCSQKTTVKNLGKDEGLEMKSESNAPPIVKQAIDNCDHDINSRQEKTNEPKVLIKHSVSSAKDSAVKGVVKEHTDGSIMHNQIKNMNSASNRLLFGKTKLTSARSLSLQSERERLADNLHRQDGPYIHVNRNERWDGRFLKSESESEDQSSGRNGYNIVNTRRPDNRFGDPRGGRNSDTHRASEYRKSKGFRFPRPSDGSEVAFADGPVGNAGRRRLADDEPPHFTRFPPRRRSPVLRERLPPMGIPVSGCIRDVSPGRFIRRDGPDSFVLTHEEGIMRGLPDDMMEPLLFPHPRLQYDRSDHVLIRRERSLSPIPRRGHHLAQAHSPDQWSPPRRSPDALDGHPELMRCRSPLIRNRLRSPRNRPFFPDDVMVRRHGSPPYNRLSDEARDLRLMKDHDLPRSSRNMHRNMRRFDIDGPQEALDEEHFGPPHFNQLPELPGEDEFMDRRNFDERRAFARSLGQRLVVGDDGEEILPYPIEDGPSRPVRFCPEADGVFPDGGGSRELDNRVRNRVGSAMSRLRGMREQEDDFRYHGPQGWHDGDFNGVKIKRRRY
ncbi:uncharacterized protein [Typha latifolia]|uniref:uncharacterized protein n=1 Tax=Typha latifolia TaxID=4733 RepID=UPI003C2FB0AD